RAVPTRTGAVERCTLGKDKHPEISVPKRTSPTAIVSEAWDTGLGAVLRSRAPQATTTWSRSAWQPHRRRRPPGACAPTRPTPQHQPWREPSRHRREAPLLGLDIA